MSEWSLVFELLPEPSTDVGPMRRVAKRALAAGATMLAIPDTPFGRVRMSAWAAGVLVKDLAPVLVHVSGARRDRVGVAADVLGGCALGLDRVLTVRGDGGAVGGATLARWVTAVEESVQVAALLHCDREDGLENALEKKAQGAQVFVALGLPTPHLLQQMRARLGAPIVGFLGLGSGSVARKSAGGYVASIAEGLAWAQTVAASVDGFYVTSFGGPWNVSLEALVGGLARMKAED